MSIVDLIWPFFLLSSLQPRMTAGQAAYAGTAGPDGPGLAEASEGTVEGEYREV